MSIGTRHLATLVAAALVACSLSGCGTINEKLAAGISDAIPAWIGGLPADAPPRPGSVKYDEYMRERERKRLEPAAPKDETSQASPSPQDPVH
jgi:hypothetical protein